MSFTTSLTLVLDAKQGVELIWGGATQVWNFFSKSDLQPAAAVYFANCALHVGDSGGWRDSLQAHALRYPMNEYKYGDLVIGHPGADFLPDLVKAKYDTRWLGVLSVLATITNESTGAENLQTFLKKTASDPTRQFWLHLSQCEKMWTISRELFCGSAYWYKFLEITSICVAKYGHLKAGVHNFTIIDHIFPPNDSQFPNRDFCSIFLTAAIDLWQLSRKPESAGKVLWAEGSVGFAQLIFYLSVVCGFYVRLSAHTDTFGQQTPGEPEIVIDNVNGQVTAPWKVGYLVEGAGVVDAIRSVLPSSDEDAWRLSLSNKTTPSASTYQINKE